MKKIVFLGYVVPLEEANHYSGASIAGNKMQWNVIKNLSQIEGIQITCITVTPLAVFPHDKNLYQKYIVEDLFPNVKSYRISFCNMPVIKQFWQIINMFRTSKKVIKETGADTVMCFNLFPQIGVPMRWLKKHFPKLDTVCLLADLPIDDKVDRKGFSRWLRKRFDKSTFKSMQICERYIILNKHVIDRYLPGKQFMVVDGGVSEQDIEKYRYEIKKSPERNIIYCGALTDYNGIDTLIDAMDLVVAPDIVLDIYGSGYLSDKVKIAADKNKKIRYYGRVDNDIVIQKQREAWLLVNPRKIHNLISEVTFPSKTFEYLLSGTPVLTTPLNGYGEEYIPHMKFSRTDSSEDLAAAINKIAATSQKQMDELANGARDFIISEKSWENQCRRIYKFLMKEECNEIST